MRKINPSAFLWHLCPLIEVRSSNVAYHHKRSSKKFVKWGFSLLCDYLWPRWLVKNATIYLLSSFWTFGRAKYWQKSLHDLFTARPHLSKVSRKTILCSRVRLTPLTNVTIHHSAALVRYYADWRAKVFFHSSLFYIKTTPKKAYYSYWWISIQNEVRYFVLPHITYFLNISTNCTCSYRAFWVGSPLTDGLFCQRIWQPLKTFPLQRPMEYLFSMPAVTEALLCQFFQSQKNSLYLWQNWL